jgi:tagaturonate reductase
MRNVPVIQNYLDRFGAVPEHMSLGLAAYLLFMKCGQAADGKFYGEANGKQYLVNDDNAGWYAEKWKQSATIPELVQAIMTDEASWGPALVNHAGWLASITNKLQELLEQGAPAVIQQISKPAKPVATS